MIRKASFLFISILLIACSEKTVEEIPSNILSQQKMAEVMLDIHLLEAAMSLNTYNADRVTNGNPLPDFDVFSHHQISKKQYEESFEYYAQHPDLLNEIYQQVLENLSKMQAEVMNEKEEEKVKKDSIKPALNQIFKNKNSQKNK